MAQQFTLPDGRSIDYLVSGAVDGFPLVWIHGTPASYLPIPSFATECEQKGIKLITMSRAGYGGSSRHKGRKIVDCVSDIQAVIEHLGVKQCLVGGWSGGGPYSLACAARLPGCLAALSVAGVAPYDAEGFDFLAGQGQDNIEEFEAALKGEDELRKFCEAARPGMVSTSVDGLIDAMASLLPEADRKALREHEWMGQYTIDMFNESLKLTVDGWIDDNMALIAPWGFAFTEIKVPVILYQGDQDKMVPFSHGQWLAEHLPHENLTKHLLPGEGHVSVFIGRGGTMIDELKAAAKL